jgi:hypothetical protein
MSRSSRAFHGHAQAVLEHELSRARGQLGRLPHKRRLAVEELSARVAAAVVDSVLEQARHDPALAQALVSIYGAEQVWEPRAALWVAD